MKKWKQYEKLRGKKMKAFYPHAFSLLPKHQTTHTQCVEADFWMEEVTYWIEGIPFLLKTTSPFTTLRIVTFVGRWL